MEEENSTELLQRFRRDRRILLNFILSGSLIKKVVMPPGAVSLDDVDLDQDSIDFVLNCARKGGLLELSAAIRDYHDSTLFPHMEDYPHLSLFPHHHQFFQHSQRQNQLVLNHLKSCPVYPNLSLSSTQQQELTIDDIEDFDDEDDLDEVDSRRYSRRVINDASDLVLGLSSFATAIGDDNLRETAYEILLAAAGASGSSLYHQRTKRRRRNLD